jgi:PPE-repeat protein
MATEAHYAEMWAQDAAAMYAYAASSASAGTLTPMTPPAPTANPAGLVVQAAAVAHAGAVTGTQAGLIQTISSLPNAVAALASPLAAAAVPSSILSNTFVQNAINGTVNVTAWWVMNTISNAVLLSHMMSTAAATPAAFAGAQSVASGVGVAGSANFVGAPVLAGLGQASTVGGLSVPATWSAATPAVGSEASLAASGWAPAPDAAEEAGMPAVAPLAAVGSAGRSLAFGGPRYGFKPTVMPKSVFG